jgi:hypothetical protein
MYTFVFLWTPALSPAGEKLPHGFIFAIFMTASMVGTALAGRLVRVMPLEVLMQVSFGSVGCWGGVCLFLCVGAAGAGDAARSADAGGLAWADVFSRRP